MSLLMDLRDRAVGIATAGRTTVTNGGVRLTLRDASPRMRYALVTGYELEDARLARRLLVPGDRVLELGSSIGFMALYCRTQLGIRDYAMVEANPALAPLIEENFRLNGVDMPPLFVAAAGPEDGTARFAVNRDYWSSSLVERDRTVAAIDVPQRSIPSLVAALPFAPNVLVMDIEGGEARIPAEHWLGFDKIIVEFHERLIGDGPVARIREGLLAAGFRHAGQERRSHAFVRDGEAR